MIWCVEDDAGIRDIEVYTLASMGFEARGFADGGEFRQSLAGEKPDLVILDVMLPGEDGVELLKLLKSSPDTREIPVIMATAKGMEYDKKNFDNKIFRFIYTEAMKGTVISLSYKGEKTDL